jgi:hypothetical protein
MSVAEQAEEGRDGSTQRTCHCPLHKAAACGIDERLYRSFTTVGNRDYCNLSLWKDRLCSGGNGLSGLGCRETSFERLGSDEDAHTVRTP